MKKPDTDTGSIPLTQVDRSDVEEQRAPLDAAIIRRLLAYMSRYQRVRNLLLVCVLIRALQLPMLAWCMAAIINGPIKRCDYHGTLLGIGGFLLLAVSTQLVLHFRFKFALQLGEMVIHDLRGQLFVKLQAMRMSYYDRTKLGRIISRFMSDATAVRNGIQNVLFVTLVGLGQMTVAAILMFYYDWLLFLALLGFVPVLWTLNVIFRRRFSEVYRAVQESFSRVTATVAESVSGIRVTQGFSRQSVNAGLFHELITDHSNYSVGAAQARGVFLPLLELNNQIFLAVMLVVGGWQVLYWHFDAKLLVEFFLMAPIFFAPLVALGRTYDQAMAAMAGAERVFGVLDDEPDWQDPPDAVELPPIKGCVQLENVSFAYVAGSEVLHDISFTAEPGQMIAVVGHTGSGKSTITNLIAKFYLPTAGRVLIDGYDITTVQTDSVHTQLGIVLQQNFLFTGTVMDNIRVGRPAASNENVRAAAERLGCLDLLELLPDGLMTEVGESGASLSLGQRQLVCFTRAMLADPRIMILDEATSAVDTVTEARIQKALDILLRGRTSFVVAHRLSTIRHADLVLVLEAGRCIERGTHEELLTLGGTYTDLYRQFVRANEES